MKQRLISAFFALLLLAGVLVFFDTPLANAVFTAVGGLCIFESLRAYKLSGNYLLLAVFELVHLLNMFFEPDRSALSFVVIFSMFALLVARDGADGGFSAGAAAAMLTLTVTSGFRAMLALRAMSPLKLDGIVLFVISIAFGLLCDSFAYFVGRFFGRHKLAPVISPNKTTEGALGGIIGTSIFTALALWLYASNAPEGSVFAGMTSWLDVGIYALIGALGSMCGILGDLAMSFVKRDAGIKDFGKIMPGHGGALDRLDSVLFSCVFAQVAFGLLFASRAAM